MASTKLRQLVLKQETTPGTAAALTASEGGYRSRDLIIQPSADWTTIPREGYGFSGGAPGPMVGTATFGMPIGDDDSGWASTILPACGLTESLDDFTIDEGGANSEHLTIASYIDGKIKKLYGAKGNAIFTFEAGKPCFVEFEFTGIWAAVTDNALLTISSYSENLPPKWSIASGLTLGGTDQKAATCTLNLNNTIKMVEDPNDTDGNGLAYAEIVNTEPTIDIDPAGELVATDDRYGSWLARTKLAFALTLSNNFSIASADTKISNVQEGDRDGLEVDNITLQVNNSDLTITCSATA